MRVPFIKVKQKSEVFFVCKMNALELKKHIDFKFRDPYYKYKNERDLYNDFEYNNKLNRRGINISCEENGFQRKLNPNKITSIKKFLEEDASSFFPTSIILSLNVKEDENDKIISILEENEVGEFEIDHRYRFNIIDGQHRLAGIYVTKESISNDFEIPVILLIDVAVSNATKIFLDINANQTAINKSLVYDLYEEIDNESIYEIRKIHTICQKFYINEKSPLYKQIKMLGVGSGAISQAFFIDTVIEALKHGNLINYPTQDIYNELFNYFRAYQNNFQRDWPVILEKNKFDDEYKNYSDDEYSDLVLKKRKSQLVKTTGFGGIIMAFPYIYEYKKKSTKTYMELIKKIRGNIEWTSDFGTGKSAQKSICNKILEIVLPENN